MALFGVKWTSQFGESVDASGQWLQTLKGVTRAQMAAALEEIRMSGRVWPPTAPELRSLCIRSSQPEIKSVELAYAELYRFNSAGRHDTQNLSPEVRHTVLKNMNFCNFKQATEDKAMEIFKFAYRATVEQFRSGDEIYEPPKPETLIEDAVSAPILSREEHQKRANETISDLMKMFDGGEHEEIDVYDEKLERIKRGEM